MKIPTATQLIMGYKPNPYELRYTRLPDAMSDGSRLSSIGSRYEVYWSTINMPANGFKALNQVLGIRNTLLGKQRALGRMDREEGIIDSMYPANRFSTQYVDRKSSATNIVPDVDYGETSKYYGGHHFKRSPRNRRGGK